MALPERVSVVDVRVELVKGLEGIEDDLEEQVPMVMWGYLEVEAEIALGNRDAVRPPLPEAVLQRGARAMKPFRVSPSAMSAASRV
jgi:hypothetical protein